MELTLHTVQAPPSATRAAAASHGTTSLGGEGGSMQEYIEAEHSCSHVSEDDEMVQGSNRKAVKAKLHA